MFTKQFDLLFFFKWNKTLYNFHNSCLSFLLTFALDSREVFPPKQAQTLHARLTNIIVMPQWRAHVDKAILPFLMLPDTCQSHRPGRGVTLTHTQCQSSGPAVSDHYLLLKVWVTSTANCTHCHTNVQNTLEMAHAPLHISKIFIVRILKCDLHIL